MYTFERGKKIRDVSQNSILRALEAHLRATHFKGYKNLDEKDRDWADWCSVCNEEWPCSVIEILDEDQ